eukprot:SAG31_NODE_3665_length_4008_cov_1.196726_5_plen_58_part_00
MDWLAVQRERRLAISATESSSSESDIGTDTIDNHAFDQNFCTHRIHLCIDDSTKVQM